MAAFHRTSAAHHRFPTLESTICCQSTQRGSWSPPSLGVHPMLPAAMACVSHDHASHGDPCSVPKRTFYSHRASTAAACTVQYQYQGPCKTKSPVRTTIPLSRRTSFGLRSDAKTSLKVIQIPKLMPHELQCTAFAVLNQSFMIGVLSCIILNYHSRHHQIRNDSFLLFSGNEV